MSAFVVSDTHLDALLSAADLWGVQMPPSQPGTLQRNLSLDESGAMLKAVNAEAVFYLYEGRHGTDAPQKPYAFGRLGINIAPGAILKAIACYRYQTCEHPQWRADRDTLGLTASEQTSWAVSAAQTFLEDLERAAIQRTPGYQDAPWGIENDQRDIFGGAVVRLF